MSSTWGRRVWHLLNRRRFERDLSREMRAHREMMPDPKGFGDPHRLLERSRDAWGWNWLDDAMQDLGLGIRGLMRAPAFAITGVLILTFGIGLNLTLFQIANVSLIKPPDVTNPHTLARFRRHAPNKSSTPVAYPITQAVARESNVLAAVLVESATTMMWGDEMLPLTALFVSPNWFSELGGMMAQGRGFSPTNDSGATTPVAVVSHQFWRARLGSSPSIVGGVVPINRKPVNVIGITAPEFKGLDLDQPAIWLVMDQREYFFPDSPFLRSWSAGSTGLYGRLKDGVTPAAARESLRSLMKRLHEERPNDIAEDEWLEPAMASVNFVEPRQMQQLLRRLSIVGSLTTLVLIVAAANIGNLVLSRATGRSRELGVRVALGAKRSRIVRQLMVETLPLALLGAAGGVLFAVWAADTIAAIGGMADNISFTPDWRTIVVSLLMSGITLVVIGAVPAWKIARQELISAIKDGGQQMSMNLDKARMRRFMIATQVCGSCLILVLAAMMTRTLQRLVLNDLGFEFTQAAILDPVLSRYGFNGAGAIAYWNAVKDRVERHPETAGVTLALSPPLGGRIHETSFNDAPGLAVVTNHIEPSFFQVMSIPLLAGRTFQRRDDPKTTVIVSRLLAERMYGTVDILGRGFPQSNPDALIVGVVGDAHAIRLGSLASSELYRPLAEADYVQVVLIARGRADAAALAPILREAAGIDSRILPMVALLRDSFERRVTGARIVSGIAVSTGFLTLAIACLGIFGVVSYGTALRVREFGIHLTLGADRASLIRLVARHVVWPIAIGMTLGAAAAVPIGLALTGGVLQLETADPAAYASALALFLLAALTAVALPAIRVLRSDPMEALRQS